MPRLYKYIETRYQCPLGVVVAGLDSLKLQVSTSFSCPNLMEQGGGYAWIASVGQTIAQAPQSMQVSGLIT